MRQLFALIKKENFTFFNSWSLWIIGGSYIFLSTFLNFFMGGFFSLSNAGLYSFFSFQNIVFIFVCPAITMKLWAEERKYGTVEFLLTQPISLSKLVLGKFLSCLCIIGFLLFISFPFWLYCALNYNMDDLNILTTYFGCFLMGCAFCAIGCMISALSTSSAISYIGTLLALFLISFADFSHLMHLNKEQEEIYIRLQNSLNFDYHYYDFLTGQISLDNVFYFVLLSVLGVWLNIRVLEYKKG